MSAGHNFQKAWTKAGHILTRVLDRLADTHLVLPAPRGFCGRETQNGIRISGSWSKGIWHVAFGERILTVRNVYSAFDREATPRLEYMIENPEGFAGSWSNREILSYVRQIDEALGTRKTILDHANIEAFEKAAKVFGVSLENPRRGYVLERRAVSSDEALTQ